MFCKTKLHVLFLAIIAVLATITPMKLMAQDDEAMPDSPMIIPSPNTNQSTPPVIIDESDSGGVSEVDEYDN